MWNLFYNCIIKVKCALTIANSQLQIRYQHPIGYCNSVTDMYRLVSNFLPIGCTLVPNH